jgi:hypothetical protein
MRSRDPLSLNFSLHGSRKYYEIILYPFQIAIAFIVLTLQGLRQITTN